MGVLAYHLQTGDGIIGHVCNFMMDAQNWVIGQLVIKTENRFSGEEVLIPTKNVERISYEESTVFATLNSETAAQSPAHNLCSGQGGRSTPPNQS